MEYLRSILLVDANASERAMVADYVRKQVGCVVLEADNPERALEIIESDNISALLTSSFQHGKKGLELLRTVQRLDPEVVMIAAVPAGDRELAVEVMRNGAFCYIQTPYILDEVTIAAARALRFSDATVERRVPEQRFRKSDGYCGIIGKSKAMEEMFSLIGKVAEDGVSTVLIQGESGTGKELVARAIHAMSPRKGKNFVPLNCAAIPGELLESELFGYVKGAFTGAAQTKTGRVQYADQGTLFLDEIGDMAPNLQAKLLRVLQEREFEPVGGVKSVAVDVRVVAATHRDLEKAVGDGGFREDLFYRLNVFPIFIPPLRERREDIPLLLDKFVRLFNRNKRVGLLGFEKDAMEALLAYNWPGNVRELENLVQRLAIIYEGKVVGMGDLPAKYRGDGRKVQVQVAEVAPPPAAEVSWSGAGVDFNALISDFEDRLIVQAMTSAQGNKREAARLLNLKRTTLIEKIKKKQLDQDFGPDAGD